MKAIFLCVVGFISSVYAQGQDTTNMKVDTLKEIQVVGINTTKLQPISQTRFSTTEYGYLNQQKDPFFVLDKATPSIYAQSDNGQGNGYSYMRMRGLDQTRINFNLNGIPLNEMEDQGLYFSNMPGFYNYLSSINVERGVGSSKYGNTSIAGSVDMETKSMSDSGLEISTVLKGGNDNQYVNAFYSTGIKANGLVAQIGYNYQRNVGFKEHSGNEGESVYYSLGLFKKSNIFKLYGLSGLIHNNLAFYGVPMNLIDSNYKTNLNSSTDKDTFNQNLIVFNWVNYSHPRTKFNTSVYFSNVNGTYSTAEILFGVNSYQYGAMSNMVITNGRNTSNVGINTNLYMRKHFGYDNNGYYDYPQNCQYYSNVGHKEDAIAYIKGSINGRITDVFYDMQVRSVWFNASESKTYNWVFANPKLGITIKSENNKIYLNLGITQREPTRTDMIQNIVQSDSTYRYGNTDNTKFLANSTLVLHPELVYDFEVGDNYKTEYLDINVNGYMMVINNEYVATGVIDPYSGFMIKKECGVSIRNGIESNIKVKLNKFNIFFNSQFQHNSLTLRTLSPALKIPFTPNMIASGGVTYTVKHIKTGFVGQIVSSMVMSLDRQDYVSTPYSLLNGFIDYKYRNMVLSFKITNILNSKYYIPAGVTTEPTYYVGGLFNYSLSLKIKL